MRGLTRLARLINRGLPFRGLTPVWVAGQVGLAAVVGLVLTGLVLVILSVTRLAVPYWQLWLLLTTAMLVRWLLQAIGGEATVLPPAGSADNANELPASSYPMAERWERRLSITDGDRTWHSTVVRDRVAAVVAERLRQRHGISLTHDLEAAQRVLGAPLHSFLTDPLERTPSPAELRWLVSRMEEI